MVVLPAVSPVAADRPRDRLKPVLRTEGAIECGRMYRREFLFSLAGAPAFLGGLRRVDGDWYEAGNEGDGLEYKLEPGALKDATYLTSDFLIDGMNIIVWTVALVESSTGRAFRFTFGGLPQASFRMRFPLALTDQNKSVEIDVEGWAPATGSCSSE